MSVSIDIIFILLLFLALLSTLIPTLPGVPLMFIITLIYGLVTKFAELEAWHLAIFAGIAILSLLIDYFSGLIGAKLGGANKKSLLFGVIGLIIGLITFPPFGAFLGVFIGIFVSELVQFKDHMKALKAASYSAVATFTGAIVNILLALSMFVWFLLIIF